MPNSELLKYIETARTQGAKDDEIKAGLATAGWSASDIEKSFATNSNSSLLPPPPAPHFGMWVAFLYIVLFICLYISFTGMGGILHHLVNQTFPDNLETRGGYSYAATADDLLLKGYISAIIVGFPIFAILFLLLKKQALDKPAVKNLRIRKILIYMTLVGTFLLMIGHLIVTLYGFLGGTITSQAVGNLAVTFLVSGSVFVYLLFEVKEDRKGV